MSLWKKNLKKLLFIKLLSRNVVDWSVFDMFSYTLSAAVLIIAESFHCNSLLLILYRRDDGVLEWMRQIEINYNIRETIFYIVPLADLDELCSNSFLQPKIADLTGIK